MPRPGPGWGAPGTGQDLGPLVPCAKLPPPPPKICSGGRHHQIDGSGGRGGCCFQMLRTGSTLAWEPEAHPWRSQVGSGLKNPKVLYLGVFRQTQTKNSPTRKNLAQFYVLKQNRWAKKMAEKNALLIKSKKVLRPPKIRSSAKTGKKSDSCAILRFWPPQAA